MKGATGQIKVKQKCPIGCGSPGGDALTPLSSRFRDVTKSAQNSSFPSQKTTPSPRETDLVANTIVSLSLLYSLAQLQSC